MKLLGRVQFPLQSLVEEEEATYHCTVEIRAESVLSGTKFDTAPLLAALRTYAAI